MENKEETNAETLSKIIVNVVEKKITPRGIPTDNINKTVTEIIENNFNSIHQIEKEKWLYKNYKEDFKKELDSRVGIIREVVTKMKNATDEERKNPEWLKSKKREIQRVLSIMGISIIQSIYENEFYELYDELIEMENNIEGLK